MMSASTLLSTSRAESINAAALGVGYFWTTRLSAAAWRPLEQLGRTSLFIYWIHVEMVYGLISRPIHHGLPFPAVLVAFALFTLFMLACSIVWERVRPGSGPGQVGVRPGTGPSPGPGALHR